MAGYGSEIPSCGYVKLFELYKTDLCLQSCMLREPCLIKTLIDVLIKDQDMVLFSLNI